MQAETFGFDAGSETLSRTNLGRLAAGSCVNLERSLRSGDRLGGHFVTGHIDGVGHLDERIDDQGLVDVLVPRPGALTRQMASKGSIAVDGVSLTLVDVEADRFSVALIPHTLQVTTLGPSAGRRSGESGNRRAGQVRRATVAMAMNRLDGPFAKWGRADSGS